MMLAIAAALAIVVQDHTALRSAAQSGASELTTLSQGGCARDPWRAGRLPAGLQLPP
jgi:hypothetical protein